jgi:ATP synthase protein I
VDDDAHHPTEPVGEAAVWTVLAYLISGPAVYGGMGWALDRWLDTEFLTPIGLVVGMALAIWLVVVRYLK